jgi:general secretion pathway protein D
VGDPFGPTGSGGQGAAGTLLAIRPVVIRDGLIYLDVRRATQGDNATTGARAAALTNQFALQEGETAVVGGFYADQLATQYDNTSAMSNVPLLGRMFRKQADIVERTETIVLLTPHIVESSAGPPLLPPASAANAR